MAIRVLLADDHVIVRDGLQVLLESESDFQVVGGASTGSEAVQKTKELRPDVVVMDIAMPEMDGIEATRQIRRACPTVPVVMLSMYASAEHVYQSLRAGAEGFVVKEAAGREVGAAIHAVLSGRRFLSQPVAEKLAEDYLRVRRSARDKSPMEKLSPRERQVLKLVAEGLSSAEIGAKIHLSPKSVDTYRSRLMQKLGVGSLVELVKFAIQNGLVPPG